MIEKRDAGRLGTPGEDDGEFLVGAACTRNGSYRLARARKLPVGKQPKA